MFRTDAVPPARTRPRTLAGRAVRSARDAGAWLRRTPLWLMLILADIAIILSVGGVLFAHSYPNSLERQWDTIKTRAMYEATLERARHDLP